MKDIVTGRVHLSALIVIAVFSSWLPIGAQSPSVLTLTGRLAVVEPAAARITIVAEGEAEVRPMAVDRDAEIRQGERKLTLSELVIEVGRRVTIRYRQEEGRLVATSITVEAEQSATLRAAATRPIQFRKRP